MKYKIEKKEYQDGKITFEVYFWTPINSKEPEAGFWVNLVMINPKTREEALIAIDNHRKTIPVITEEIIEKK